MTPADPHDPGGVARFGDRVATGVVEVAYGDAAVRALDGSGFWAVVATFEGQVTAVRFADVRPAPPGADAPAWGPLTGTWRTSLDEASYVAAVHEIRRRIAAGTLYQANLCRVLTHPLAADADLDGLAARLRAGNPAPYAGRVRVGSAGLDVVCASPELFLRREGDRVVSGPIKGTAPTTAQLRGKDVAENVMIVDLVRHDLSAVCRPGSVDVERLCVVEPHPGLVHLVSQVAGRLRPGTRWADLLGALLPPGSVSGAPKVTALQAVRDLEPVPRGPYCGAVGWVDADRGEAELAVGIRTFWARGAGSGRELCFGTGAGITWGSDPRQEWEETRLKAARLVGLAAGREARGPGGGPIPLPAG
ncbi:chorismate-binding protein [Lapillicoccus jejuensis]|uniref:Para-aminobenzoate synthetase component 1 n=1 Tax=Lapillicoccus jejuensis TaxID=402171 RepID=A0A542E593_9MICO|nr:chorismate-binding protein [Lapillicoccus jejuensis]TQJ10508.1 para-aminobenzoate synthetase component 1 [Lapillicoccus jejuensis]